MTTAEGFAPAKINLTLHITGQRPDGYHLLDSLVVFADIGDRLWFTAGSALSIEVTGPFARGVPTDNRNLVWKAAQACGWTGHIRLEKNLPHGAGIGGGSSDAAAVLRHVGGSDKTALALGADVPVCLQTSPQRMRGIGERLDHVWSVPTIDLVLVNPGGHLSTPQVFGALGRKENPDMGDIPAFSDRAGFLAWLSRQRNDLEHPARTCAPHIGDALAALGGAELARMSGSGATCFGIYPDGAAASTAAATIIDQHPDWWVTPCQTIGQQDRYGGISSHHPAQFKRSTT